ncbi:FtsX-like permease family protein [Nocardioides sp. LHD-245]|uniref:ABC transporter permease n=1 Tax=Nocardioides sp. LHD-245 TaxID=3051387 RepID=UPI0027DF6E86|nr:FtsX-like permease family protein [Nocardioides sp. LHD-245]
MSAGRPGLGPLVRADLRRNRSSFAGVALAILVATMVVTGLGVLVESGIRGGLAPQRYAGAPLVVTGKQSVPVPEDLAIGLAERAPAPDASLIAAVPGVTRVVADLTVPLLETREGAPIGPVEAHPWGATRLTPYSLTEGREPAAADEVAMVAGSAAVGDHVTLAHGGVRASYQVVGLVSPATTVDRARHAFLTSARIAELDPHDGAAQALGVFTEGDPDRLADRIRERHPDLTVATGSARGDAEFLDSGSSRATLVAIGSAFAGTSLLVALFIVAGTLSLSVQSRRREFALLRAVGALPRQVHALVAREVLVIAGVAALLGVGPGYLLAGVLQRAFVSGEVIPGDFALAYGPLPAVGAVLVVLLTAWAAARLAARRPANLDPVAALREGATGPTAMGTVRIVIGVVIVAAGLVLSLIPIWVRGEAAAGASASAALVLIIGAAVLGPWLVAVAVRAAQAALGRTSPAAFLATANGRANSRRLAGAVTPIALGIALGLVQLGAPAIVADEAAVQATEGVTADLRVVVPAGLSAPALDAVADLPSVTAVSPVTISQAILDHRTFDGTLERSDQVLQGVDPATSDDVLDLRVREGALDALAGAGQVALSTDAARSLGVGVGDEVTGRFGDGAPLRAGVVAIYERGLGFGGVTMDEATVRSHTTAGLASFALVASDDPSAARAAVGDLGLPVADGSGEAAGADAQAQQGWVNLIALFVILGYIAIAVVNTLAMATGERSREFALMQLVGATRGQVRAMMRLESVLVASIAALLGIGLALPPLVGISIGISGEPLPSLDLLGSATVVAGMAALALISLGVATRAALRTRPTSEIGSRQ